MKNKEKVIEEFIVKVKEKYKTINFKYFYDEELEDYMIYHDKEDLDFDEEFNTYVNELIINFLFENGFKRPVVVGKEEVFEINLDENEEHLKVVSITEEIEINVEFSNDYVFDYTIYDIPKVDIDGFKEFNSKEIAVC